MSHRRRAAASGFAYCLAAALALSACGTGYSRPPVQGSASSTGLSVVSFNPAAGALASLPASVVVTFNETSLVSSGAASVAQLSNYWIQCGGGNVQPAAVAYVAGTAAVSVTLPPIAGLSPGTSCTFHASGKIQDTSGSALQAPASVTYQVLGTNSGWVESGTVSPTAPAGGSGGIAFDEAGESGLALTGLSLQIATYVDGIRGAFQEAFNSGSTITPGEAHGTAGNLNAQLSCPGGYAITGLVGRSGQYVDALGIICKNQDQSQTFTSGLVGGPGGDSFTQSCPAGMFATSLLGRASTVIDQISLGCR